MTEDITLRFLTPEDLDQLEELEQKSFSLPWSRESYLYELTQNPIARYFGLFQGDRLLAFCGLWLIADEGHISNVATDPEFRRRGLGEKLMRSVAVWAMAHGAVFLTLEVRSQNDPAKKLYEKLGFTVQGCRKDYYDEPKDDALIMTWYF